MKNQNGWTIWTLLLTVAVLLAVVLLFMKLTPHYLDNYKLESALEHVSTNSRVANMTRREIIRELKNKLYIDYGDELINLDESLVIEKGRGGMSLYLDYEVVVPLVANVSALLAFNNSADVVY
jgi:hypothetical protein